MADELLNVQDLIAAKKHDTFHSEVITGKAGGVSTGANIDYATNAVTGQVQKTLPATVNGIDWSYVGKFADGVTFTKQSDFALDSVGTQWVYTGTFPFTATAGTVPSEPTYQAVHVRDHNSSSNRNDVGAHDAIYDRRTTVAELESGVFTVAGTVLKVADRDDELFIITSGGTPNGIGIIDAGNGNTAVLQVSKEVSLVALGADKFGNTDCTPVLEVAKTLGAKIRQHNGSFLIASDFKLTDGFDLKLTGDGEFVRKTAIKWSAGNKDTNTPLVASGSWAIGKRTITLDAASYAAVNVGDTLYIQNKLPVNSDFILDFVANPNNLNDWVYQVQTPIVKSKNGSNQITVSQAAKLTYNFGGTALIARLDDVVRNVKIRAKFRNEVGTPLSSEHPFISASCLFGLDVAGSKFYMNNESPGIYITVGRLDSIMDAEFHDGRNLDIFLRQDCPNSKLIGGKFFTHRTNDASIFVEAHNYNITLHGNSFEGALWDDTSPVMSAIQMDAKVNNCSITSNQVIGYPVGLRMELGCFSNSVHGNNFELCEISGLRMVGTRSNTVTGNTFLDCGLSTTANATLSQQQGGIYVNGVLDTTINDNTMTWVNPSFAGNFFAGLSGSMSNSSFRGNSISQARRAVWLLATSSNNDISDNPKLEAIGNDNVVLINGTTSHYNKVNRNFISGNDAAESTGVYIENGSEGNEIQYNRMINVVYATKLVGASNYQGIKGNHGDFSRNCNVTITAPVMPSNATAERGFTIYEVQFDQIQPMNERYVYTQNIGGVGNRWNKMTETATTIDL